ncbi:hydrogenobyrinic acid a,c-diamide synthase (glutamine-hydrolyzing) [Desulfallas sp. Bu1-1]|uniref:cobyrinate a,c-diamide synthase n=1 Tax=Desulfallas sp. Bu1-1 TaxID=2787620 RepID=UPI00189D0529|nr:cobyrinate a,c-diamide synthase [Desulfallas sp. Bu1-1]MBF7081480.1 hydrogenobyrinic acid a,c-diamide synthase (glutamine-hydrolyzing) [Desulfallas sp. Bu1-1]
MRQCNIPRLVIAAPHGRSGKTTATIGLLSALKSGGYRVQPYKKGPDFIDPSWMTRITGRPCRNLDSFLMDREAIRASFVRSALDADIAVVEGAMGLFDGVDLEGSGSTAEIAKTIGAPVLLVVDTTRMTRSVAAMVSGYMHFDPGVHVAGVILNKVARPRHEQMLRAAIERYCGIPVLGVIPKGKKFNIPDRHLGLIPAAEDDALAAAVDDAGSAAGDYLDLPGIVEIAKQAGPIQAGHPLLDVPVMQLPGLDGLRPAVPRIRVAVFLDRAFTFYYPENLEALAAAGAELVPVNALQDNRLPDVDAAYIGGGFPEMFAAGLAANEGLSRDLRNRIEVGLPVYAECGGLMYLGRKLIWNGREYAMSGALPFDVTMTDQPQGHGYITLEVEGETPYFKAGASVRGHEFHHSRVVNLENDKVRFAFRVTRGYGIDGTHDGVIYKNVLACYTHLHALSSPGWAEKLVAAGENYRARSTH